MKEARERTTKSKVAEEMSTREVKLSGLDRRWKAKTELSQVDGAGVKKSLLEEWNKRRGRWWVVGVPLGLLKLPAVVLIIRSYTLFPPGPVTVLPSVAPSLRTFPPGGAPLGAQLVLLMMDYRIASSSIISSIQYKDLLDPLRMISLRSTIRSCAYGLDRG